MCLVCSSLQQQNASSCCECLHILHAGIAEMFPQGVSPTMAFSGSSQSQSSNLRLQTQLAPCSTQTLLDWGLKFPPGWEASQSSAMLPSFSQLMPNWASQVTLLSLHLRWQAGHAWS